MELKSVLNNNSRTEEVVRDAERQRLREMVGGEEGMGPVQYTVWAKTLVLRGPETPNHRRSG